LSGTDINDAGLAQIAVFTNLRELYISHGRFSDKGLAALKPLQNLERIAVVRTGPETRGGSSGRLEELDVGQSGLHVGRRQRARSPAESPKLHELSLDSVNATDRGAETLKLMTGLKALNCITLW
jgi:hypothetical protein